MLFENCPMNFKTVKKLISCALPAWLLLGSGQNLLGSGRFWSVPARFWSVLVGSCYIKYAYTDKTKILTNNSIDNSYEVKTLSGHIKISNI